MKKILIVLLSLIVVSSLVVGCAKTSPDKDTPPVKEPDTEVDVGNKDPVKPVEPSGIQDEVGAKLSKVYSEMMKNKKYLMKYKITTELDGKDMESIVTTAISGEKQAIISNVDGRENTMVFMDDKVYMIDHTEKMVLEMPAVSNMDAIETEEIETDGMEYIGSGKEDGLVYEEYSIEDGKLKYFFDGDKLVKIVSIIDEEEQVMEIIEMSDKVTDSMFEIPADYQRAKMPASN